MKVLRSAPSLCLACGAFQLAAIAAGGLLPQPAAAALDFGFSFSGVEGVIEGLVDNSISQPARVDVKGGMGVPTESLGTYLQIGGTGFSVSGGIILPYLPPEPPPGSPPSSEYSPFFVGQNTIGHTLSFESSPATPEVIVGSLSGLAWDPWLPFGGDVTFHQRSPASVPSPLPLAGCGLAFVLSRELRRRRHRISSINNATQPIVDAPHQQPERAHPPSADLTAGLAADSMQPTRRRERQAPSPSGRWKRSWQLTREPQERPVG
jgi:hypothetical protein